MNKKTIKVFNPQFIAVLSIAIITAVLSILHVILGLAKTPKNYIYTATGHYYLDYFVYLQAIAQGIAGKILPINLLASDDVTISLRFLPYTLLGQIGRIFALSPMFVYWFFTFIFTIIFIFLIYLAINKMMRGEKTHLKISALLLAIFSCPFFLIKGSLRQITLIPYDFWYGPSNFMRRFGTVPYHLLSFILGLITLFFISDIIEKLPVLSFKKILLKILIAVLTLSLLLLFSPFVVITLLITIFTVFIIFFIKSKKNVNYLIYLIGLFLFFVPIALIIQKTYYSSPLINTIKGIESQWQERVPLIFLLLNLGPMILFFPFGIIDFFKNLNIFKLLTFVFVLVSYALFLSPAASYLKTHNLRFLSSINYAFFGVLAVLGLKTISKFFKHFQTKIVFLLMLLFLIYSSIFNIYTLTNRIQDKDSYTPITTITYLPKNLINGLDYLKEKKGEVALTGPYGNLGLLVPVFSVKKVYLGRENETPNFADKQIKTNLFFQGKLTQEEGRSFIYKNKINFVVKTAIDNYLSSDIDNYHFLKLIFTNPAIQIWEVMN